MRSLWFGECEVLLPERDTGSLVIGHRIWPSCLILCQYLTTLDLQGKAVLDLGSGTGLASLMALKCGAKHVYLQDIPGDEEIRRIQGRLMEANGVEPGRYTTVPLMWGDPPTTTREGIDLIVSADTFYEETRTEHIKELAYHPSIS